MGHTPGPWKNSATTHYLIEADGGVVADVLQNFPAVECYDNARLIAGAPELLEACKAALDVWTRIDLVDELRARARTRNLLRAAIAKATTPAGGDDGGQTKPKGT